MAQRCTVCLYRKLLQLHDNKQKKSVTTSSPSQAFGATSQSIICSRHRVTNVKLAVNMSVLRQVLGLSAWIRALVIFVLLWGLLVLIFASKLNGPNSSALSNEDYTNHRLNQAIEFLEESKRRNSELKQLIDEFLR